MSWAAPLAAIDVAALGLYSARRLVMLVAALLPRRRFAERAAEPPSVTLVVPARDEAAGIDRLLAALSALDYPEGRLFLVLVDDCSQDGTGERLERWCKGRPRALTHRLERWSGKPAALNHGIAAAPAAEVVVTCDADLAPHPDSILRLVETFSDETVAAVAGYLRPCNADDGAIARYAAVESWTHQLITAAGKDRLDLNPPASGFSAYRRSALEQIGFFEVAGRGEDVVATVALTRAGWRTRFAPDSVADNIVVHRLRDYWRQHLRWARSAFDATRRQPRRGPRGPILRQVEAWAMSSGYVDRLALLVAVVLVATGTLPPWIPPAYLAVIALGVTAALLKAGVGARRAPLFAASTAGFFALDVVALVVALPFCVRPLSRGWRSPTRAPGPLPRLSDDIGGTDPGGTICATVSTSPLASTSRPRSAPPPGRP